MKLATFVVADDEVEAKAGSKSKGGGSSWTLSLLTNDDEEPGVNERNCLGKFEFDFKDKFGNKEDADDTEDDEDDDEAYEGESNDDLDDWCEANKGSRAMFLGAFADLNLESKGRGARTPTAVKEPDIDKWA